MLAQESGKRKGRPLVILIGLALIFFAAGCYIGQGPHRPALLQRLCPNLVERLCPNLVERLSPHRPFQHLLPDVRLP
jgi:hypothetical protein